MSGLGAVDWGQLVGGVVGAGGAVAAKWIEAEAAKDAMKAQQQTALARIAHEKEMAQMQIDMAKQKAELVAMMQVAEKSAPGAPIMSKLPKWLLPAGIGLVAVILLLR